MQTPKYHIKPSSIAEDNAIEKLIASAFGEKRNQRLINRLRDKCKPYSPGCFSAHRRNHSSHNEILGAIRYFLAAAESGEPFLFLGPLAVLPELRGFGIGKNLIKHSLQHLKDSNGFAGSLAGVLIVGDAGYYAPFGFSPTPVANLKLGGSVAPLTFMGLEWKANAMANAKGSITFIDYAPKNDAE